MTDYMQHKAMMALMTSRKMFHDDRYIPKVYVVGKSIYWFLNAARRAAYCENHIIEEMTVEQAFAMYHDGAQIDQSLINRTFDQRGETFGPFLFCDNCTLKWNSQEVRKYERSNYR